jgi:hypothetical protein
VQRRRFGATEPVVKIGGKTYVLAVQQGRPVFSSGTRAIEGVPSDDFEIRLENDGRGFSQENPHTDDSSNFVPGRVYPHVGVTNVNLGTSVATDIPRWAFETQDANGTWYLLIISHQHVYKLELSATPVLRTTEGPGEAGPPAPWNASDRLGQPAFMFSARMGGFRWMVPLNNGTRFAVLDTVGVGAAANTWTVATIDKAGTGEDGALAFLTLPSGKAVRAVADSGNPGVAKISILTASADAETAGNWGAAFPVDAEGFRILNLIAFDETIIVRKQNGYFAAVEQGNGTLGWRTLLPDSAGAEVAAAGQESVGGGIVWHGQMVLPTASDLWLHNLVAAGVASPSAVDWTPEDDIAFNAQSIRFGRITALAHGGKWLFAAYERVNNSLTALLAARENVAGRPDQGKLSWFTLKGPDTPASGRRLVYVHQNGVSAPRLVWTALVQDWEVFFRALSPNRDPHVYSGSWGQASQSGDYWFGEQVFGSTALLREVLMEIGRPINTPDEIGWRPLVSRDGGAAETLGQLSSTGAVFWTPGTNDTCRRAYFGVRWTATAGWNPVNALPPYLRSMTVRGSYLPDVSDPVQFTIDIEATARRRHLSRKAVIDELRGYRSSRQPWTDPNGQSGHIKVTDTTEGAPARAGSLEGLDVLTVKAMLVEYS